MVVILPSAYRDGTVSVTTGTTAVTGSLTLFQKSVLPGDWFSTGDGYFILISEVTDDTNLVLDTPYPGATVTDSRYAIMLQSDIARMQETSRQLLQTLSNGNLEAFASLSGNVDLIPIFTAPGAMTLIPKSELTASFRFDATVPTEDGLAAYANQVAGFRVLIENYNGTGRSAFVEKKSATVGDWSDAVFLTGTVGPVGPGASFQAGTATSLDYGQPPTLDVTQNPDGSFSLNVGIPQGQNGTGTGDVQGPDGGTTVNQFAAFSNTTGKLIKGLSVLEALTALGPVSAGKPAPIPSAAGLGLSNGNFNNVVLPGAYSITGSYTNGPLGNPATHTGHLEVRNASNLSVTQVFRNFIADDRGTVYKRIGYRATTGAAWTWEDWDVTEATGNVSGGGQNDSIFALEIADLKGQRLGIVGGVADAFDDETGVDLAGADGGIDSNTLLCLHMDGVDGGTVFRDASPYSRIVTATSVTTSTAQSKFGGSSLLVSGAGGLTIPDSDDWAFGTGNFTIDVWVRITSFADSRTILSQSSDTNNAFRFVILNNGAIFFESTSGGSTVINMTSSAGAIVVNTWAHIAIVRNGNSWAIYKDGVSVQTATNSGTIPNISAPMVVGRVNTGQAFPMVGNIDELRISKVARWTSAFSAPSQAYFAGNGGNDSNTVTLIHFDGVNGSTDISDVNIGGAAKVWTRRGTPTISTSVSKFGGASAVFSGGDNGWTTPAIADFQVGAGDFTIDAWVRASGGTGGRLIYGDYNASGAGASLLFGLSSATGNRLFGSVINSSAATTTVNGTTDLVAGQFYHVAFVRAGNVLKLFVDGVQEGGDVPFTGTVRVPVSVADVGVGVPGDFAGEGWNGYIDEFRFSKGIARWTSNFIPPNEAYYGTASLTTGQVYNAALDHYTPAGAVGANQIPQMTANTTSGVTMSASDTNTGAGFQVWYAGDRNNASSWITNNGNTSGWLQVFFGAGNAKDIRSYSLLNRPSAINQSPSAWNLLGSNNGTDWVTLDTRTGETAWTEGVVRTFNVATPGSYTYYRLSVSAVQSGGIAIGIAEITLNLGGSILDMNLQSVAYNAEIVPATARFALQITGGASFAINTDVIGEVSRNGGVSWTVAELLQTTTLSGIRMYEAENVDISGQTSGTSMKWRVRTRNAVSPQISGVVLHWKE